MIAPFEHYVKSGKVKRKTPDPEEAASLLQKARDRMFYCKTKRITDRTASFILEDAYESIRESAQALMSLKGFKPYSHEATISFLKEYYSFEFNEDDLAGFDRFRGLRHDSVYKAVLIHPNDAKACVLFAARIIPKLKKMQPKITTPLSRSTTQKQTFN